MKQGDFVIRPAARGNDGDFSASVRLEMKTGFLVMEKTELSWEKTTDSSRQTGQLATQEP